METLIYCVLDEGTLDHAHQRFDSTLAERGLSPKEGSPNVWVCGDCFSAADDAIEAVHEAAKSCGVVVKRAFAVVDEANTYTDEHDS